MDYELIQVVVGNISWIGMVDKFHTKRRRRCVSI